jgi:serine/threonine protein kinase
VSAVRSTDEVLASECRECGKVVGASGVSTCDQCGEPLEFSCLPLDLHGKFRLVRRLGRGGMGVVYLAEDTSLNRAVALKTLPHCSKAAIERLQREARIMASLNHAHLASIYGFERWNDRPVLIAEYLEGGTLSTRASSRGGIATKDAVRWTLELCDGLDYLHQRELLHGDVKPSNLGFDLHDNAKLLDFGLAAPFRGDAAVAGDGGNLRWGTWLFTCPEAATRPPCPQFDLWSLALVLYELLAQRLPFGTESARRGGIPDIREYRADVPRELAGVLAAALHSDFERRPRSALEFSLWLNQARPIV